MFDDFRKGCESIKGTFSDEDGVLFCRVGSREVDIISYDPAKGKAVIRDHAGRRTEVDKVDGVASGTLWMQFSRPKEPVMITNPEGEEATVHDFRKGK